ncbi:MAG TPA: pyruvate kinase [Solirubrobacterales bacterium]|nr:pyruvate kinase [Solirubrobacterales bacterium]
MPLTSASPGIETSASRLYDSVTALRVAVASEADEIMEGWGPRIERDEFMTSARNLAAYIAVRHHDLRKLQLELMPLGLSSLGRCEARVLPNLDAVIAALSVLRGDGRAADGPDRDVFFEGNELLRRQTEAAFGPTPPNRAVRIMVTLPSEAAAEPGLARDLVSVDMDIARINCAHDDEAAWAEMAGHVRAAAADAGRPCRVCFDLCGPRSRVDSTTVPDSVRVRLGDRVLMTPGPVPVAAEWSRQFQCSIPEVFPALEPGAAVWVNDGKLGLVVESKRDEGVLLRVTDARERGERLRPDKALNFPGTKLTLDPLTGKDLRDLDAIVPLADMVGYSFVQRPDDVARLQAELAGRDAPPDLPLVAKIETALAVESLPELIVQGAGRQPLAIMIARGDLMVEVGHRRLAEIQEELLWLCEAAHVPVIWATQVLDNLVKKGVRNRAEMTDAAMAERAECVMLNKGPHAGEAVELLDDVLGRMEGHQFKKTSRMRALRSW